MLGSQDAVHCSSSLQLPGFRTPAGCDDAAAAELHEIVDEVGSQFLRWAYDVIPNRGGSGSSG